MLDNETKTVLRETMAARVQSLVADGNYDAVKDVLDLLSLVDDQPKKLSFVPNQSSVVDLAQSKARLRRDKTSTDEMRPFVEEICKFIGKCTFKQIANHVEATMNSKDLWKPDDKKQVEPNSPKPVWRNTLSHCLAKLGEGGVIQKTVEGGTKYFVWVGYELQSEVFEVRQ